MANNTTAYAGTSGVAKFDVGGSATTIASVISFTLTNTGDVIETSAMGNTARTYVPGLTNATASMSLYFVDGDAAQAALQTAPGSAAATIELYPSGETTGQKLSGEMIVTSFEVSAANDGAVTAEVSGQITGAVTVTNL
jgi:predicted secreted protein